MSYSKKLELFFKSKNIPQKEIANKLGVSPNMISRYIRGEAEFNASFIVRMIAAYPDIDLQYIFSDEELNISREEKSVYTSKINVVEELNAIQKKIELIKEKITSEK